MSSVSHVDNLVRETSSLCLSCGLCCQGQLFGWVPLQEDEVDRARIWGVDPYQSGDRWRFNQPCRCFRDMRCSVYEARPKECVAYVCELLQRLRDGQINYPEAIAVVAEARKLVDALQVRLPPNVSQPLWRSVVEKWDLSAYQQKLASGEIDTETLMDIVTLHALLNKRFRGDEAAKP